MITVEGLTKTYGGFRAVDDVSFVAQPGRVTGFLGPNGAGKTTTMRIMVGLTPPSQGRVTIGGHAYQDIPNPGRHVGVLLDASAQHAGRTGREVLTIGARTMGLPDSRVDEILDYLADQRVLHRSGDRFHWMSDTYPAEEVSLRSAAPDNVVIIDQSVSGGRVIGEMDLFSAQEMLHDEAIYIHGAQQHHVGAVAEGRTLTISRAFWRGLRCAMAAGPTSS